MKNKILFSIATLLFTLSSAHATPKVLLELRETNGPGTLVKQILIANDGSVTKVAQGASHVIKTSDQDEMTRIENSMAAIQEGPLVRTNPSQGFNPGGFTTAYILSTGRSETFTFAKTVSGVDFGLENSGGKDLIAILNDLDRL